MKLELDLSPDEYAQLVECFFAGSLCLEDLYPDDEATTRLGTKINREAKKFGKEELVFTDPKLKGDYFISQEVESRVIPVLFGDD